MRGRAAAERSARPPTSLGDARKSPRPVSFVRMRRPAREGALSSDTLCTQQVTFLVSSSLAESIRAVLRVRGARTLTGTTFLHSFHYRQRQIDTTRAYDERAQTCAGLDSDQCFQGFPARPCAGARLLPLWLNG